MSPGARPSPMLAAAMKAARERLSRNLDSHFLDAIGVVRAGTTGPGFTPGHRIRLRCAVCQRPVDEVITEQEPGGFVRHLIARCHGAEDRMTITLHDQQNWTREERDFWSAVERGEVEGLAFARPEIGSG